MDEKVKLARVLNDLENAQEPKSPNYDQGYTDALNDVAKAYDLPEVAE